MKLVAHFRLNEVRWSVPEDAIARWRGRYPQLTVQSVEDDALLPAALVDADLFLGWMIAEDLFPTARHLRWMHSASAGIEACLFPAMVESDVVLTNSTGLHSTCIPEHVFGQILTLARNFHGAARLQARHAWDRIDLILTGGVREVAGANLAVLGAGPIGENVARLGAAFGMHVRVMRHDATRPVAQAEAVVSPRDLHALLGWADFIVLAVPLTAETRGMIGPAEFKAMKSTAYLINIARGDVVDEAAMIQTLRAGGLAGAGLDVTEAEPLPPESELWDMPTVVITPHISGYTPTYFTRMLELFEDNLERFMTGKALRNIVDKRAGYARSGPA